MTSKEILAKLEDINAECRKVHHDCQVCSYGQLCGKEKLYERLIEAYCTEANHNCEECEYVYDCRSRKAFDIRLEREKKAFEEKCMANETCVRCDRFNYCLKEKAVKNREIAEQACEKPYGCLECPKYGMCHTEKSAKISRLKRKLRFYKLKH